MPVKFITDQLQYPEWAGPRYRKLDILQRFLDGTIYDHLHYSFFFEVEDGTGRYIPLRDRRPSVRYNLARVVVNRAVSLLFGDKHWPHFHTTSKSISDFLTQLDNQSGLQAALLEAATLGSLGSVAIIFSIIDDQFFYEVWNPKYCKPLFSPNRDLKELLILVPTFGYDLKAMGYNIPPEDLPELFFFSKRYTSEEEIRYFPLKCEDYEDESSLEVDDDRSSRHNLGFVPGVWIKNFPSTAGMDSECTFEQILHFYVEIDYQLSQAGRGLKYNADPQMLIKEPSGAPDASMAFGNSPLVRSASNAILVGEDGDAKLLEISGQGQKVVIEFVQELKRAALEVVRASHKDPDKSYGNMSGRAMEILDEDLISLAATLRISYGDLGLKPLLLKILRAAKKMGMISENPDAKDFAIRFMWGNWFDPTPTDLLQTEQALDLAVKGRRLYEVEARMISASLHGVGHAEPEKLEDEWPIPPEPQIVKDEKEMKSKPIGPNGAGGGTQGRTSRVTA